MLIAPDRHELGDKRLDPKENVAKLTEENLKLSAKFKIPNQALLEKRDMAVGAPMHYSELIRRLQKLNPAIIAQDGGIKGAIQLRYPQGSETKYVTGFYKDVLPEYSSIQTDKWGKPKRENRGWRSILLTLVHAKILTYKQVVEAFGAAEGQRAILWNEQMQSKK